MKNTNILMERAFRAVAVALDQIEGGKEQDFLARLALICAREIGDSAVFEQAVQRALRPEQEREFQ